MIDELDGVRLTHRHATVGSTDIHFVDAGSGPGVILLHGFPEFWYSWRNQIPALVRAGFRVLAPDLRGYGDSSKPEAIDDYRVPRLVQDIAGLIVQEANSSCFLAGHDWGGVVAWYLPMLHPALVRKLAILNCPHPVPLARELHRSQRQKLRLAYQLFMQPPLLPEFAMKRFGYAFLQRTLRRLGRFTEPEIHVYVQEWSKPGVLRGMVHYYRALRKHRRELRPLIRPIDIPVLLLWGERDPVFMRATTTNFSEYVPDLHVERFPSAGHFVQTDASAEVSRALIRFFEGPTASSEQQP